LELDFNIAEANAVEPSRGGIAGPDDSVEEVLKVGVNGCGDKNGGADVAVAEVPGEAGADEEGDEEGKGGEEDGLGVDERGLGDGIRVGGGYDGGRHVGRGW
jgi:hypothetical protein